MFISAKSLLENRLCKWQVVRNKTHPCLDLQFPEVQPNKCLWGFEPDFLDWWLMVALILHWDVLVGGTGCNKSCFRTI